MQIHLKKGEKVYVNGAVIRAGHRCSLEFLNNVTFLLDSHVMQAEKAETPFKQIYFVVQAMLIDPDNAQVICEIYWQLSGCLHSTLENAELVRGLESSDACIKNHRYFHALKIICGLFEAESNVLSVEAETHKQTSSQKEVA